MGISSQPVSGLERIRLIIDRLSEEIEIRRAEAQ
jgi:hypothetical protein